jgi:protein-disulfide isomerase
MVSHLSLVRIILLPLAFLLASSSCFAQADIPAPTGKSITLQSKEFILEVKKDDIAFGNEKAPVTIIEYSSLSCAHCASFYNNTFDELTKKYIDDGRVRFVYRDFPLNLPALHAAMMVHCAPKDKAAKFINALFSTQNNWATKKNYLEILSNIAKLGGMTGEEFDACIANKSLEDKITEERFQAAKVLDIRATPSFYINGVPFSGGHTLESLSNIIDPLLTPASSKPVEPKASESAKEGSLPKKE